MCWGHCYLSVSLTTCHRWSIQAYRCLLIAKLTSSITVLDLPSLCYGRARGDMIETYKHMTGIYAVDAEYIKPYTSFTRGHIFKLKKERSMKHIRQQYYSNRILNSWNMLPAEVVTAPSLNAFKNRLDGHWRQYKYSQHSVHDACNLNKAST